MSLASPPPPPPPPPAAATTTPLPTNRGTPGASMQSQAPYTVPGIGDPRKPRVVVLSQLDPAEKERYFQFLLENDVDFEKVDEDCFVADVRLTMRGEDKRSAGDSEVARSSKRRQKQRSKRLAKGSSVQIYGRRASRPPQEMARVISAIATSKSLFDYSCYPKFSSLVTLRDQLRPRRRHFAWLMKTIEEIYRERYEHDTMDLRQDSSWRGSEVRGIRNEVKREQSENDALDRLSNIFPVFVVDFLSKRFGLRSLVDQNAWDVLYNVHALRKDHLEVEVFARFLEEYYDADDLLFFLYVRSVVQKELQVNFVTRWTSASRGRERMPKAIFLTFRECQIVAKIVFGSDEDPLYEAFMKMIAGHTVGQRRSARNDTRRIEVMQFLHLALVEYHETRPAEDEEDIARAEAAEVGAQLGAGGDSMTGKAIVRSKEEQRRLFLEAERQYEARMRQLSDAQMTADSQVEKDLEREMRVQEMEQAIRRAMQARRDAGEFDPRPQVDPNEETVRRWAEEALQRENRVRQATDLAEAQKQAEKEALEQREAFERARAVQLDSQRNTSAADGASPLSEQIDMTHLNDYLDTIAKDREAIEEMERQFREKYGPPKGITTTGSAGEGSSKSQSFAERSSPGAKTKIAWEQALQDVLISLQTPMKDCVSSYMKVLMGACGGLPAPVVQEIAGEVELLLNAKVDTLLRGVQGQVEKRPDGLSTPATGDNGGAVTEEALQGGMRYLVRTKQRDPDRLGEEAEKFCWAVLKMPDLRQEIEPMVALLVTYAQARLSEDETN
eukprot:g3996.t1